MPERQPNNPAGRLLALIERIKATPPRHKNVAVGWTEVLEVEHQDRSVLLSRLSRVLRMPQVAEEAVAAHESLPKETFLEWVPVVRNAFSVLNMDAPWAEVLNRLDDAPLRSLKFCDYQLATLSPEPTIARAFLDELLSHVRDVIDLLRGDATLPDYIYDGSFVCSRERSNRLQLFRRWRSQSSI